MTSGPETDTKSSGPSGPGSGKEKGLAEVLASIRELVSAETASRINRRSEHSSADQGDVLVLTPGMRISPEVVYSGPGDILTEGLEDADHRSAGAPILDEEALRSVVNTIVREELQGELGDRISRNLRKLIRREIGQIMLEQKDTRQ